MSRIKLEINNIQDFKKSIEFTEGKLEDVNTDFVELKGKFAMHLKEHVDIVKQLNKSKKMNLALKEKVLQLAVEKISSLLGYLKTKMNQLRNVQKKSMKCLLGSWGYKMEMKSSSRDAILLGPRMWCGSFILYSVRLLTCVFYHRNLHCVG